MKTIKNLTLKKQNNQKIVCITAYDYSFARIIDQCNIDLILVGDSAANIHSGHKTTIPITLNEIIYHSKAVRNAVKNSLLITDMPFLSYQISTKQATLNAGKIMKKTQVEGIKLEGGEIIADTIYHLTHIGIPVMGHIGFTPQSIHQLAGHRIQGTKENSAQKIKNDAKIIQEAGAFAIIIELIPAKLAKEITNSLNIPVIGIGAGPHCDGQILVSHDLLGMNSSFNPKFLRKYANLEQDIKNATNLYAKDVLTNKYPSINESY